MASSGCRVCTRRLALLIGLSLAAGACSTTRPPGAAEAAEIADGRAESTPARTVVVQPGPAPEPGIDLPAGAGREILVTACLSCHELTALELFSDFYGRANWRSLIVSMQANGAEVTGPDIDVLAGYLAEHFGTGAP